MPSLGLDYSNLVERRNGGQAVADFSQRLAHLPIVAALGITECDAAESLRALSGIRKFTRDSFSAIEFSARGQAADEFIIRGGDLPNFLDLLRSAACLGNAIFRFHPLVLSRECFGGYEQSMI